MQNAARVRLLKSARHLYRQPHRFLHGQRTLDGFPVDKLHYQVIRSDVVERADMWMIQRGDGPRFLLESGAAFVLEFLYRDYSIQARIASLADLAHAACTNGRENLIGAEFVACSKGHRSLVILPRTRPLR